jgi:hypothetical protein
LCNQCQGRLILILMIDPQLRKGSRTSAIST